MTVDDTINAKWYDIIDPRNLLKISINAYFKRPNILKSAKMAYGGEKSGQYKSGPILNFQNMADLNIGFDATALDYWIKCQLKTMNYFQCHIIMA